MKTIVHAITLLGCCFVGVSGCSGDGLVDSESGGSSGIAGQISGGTSGAGHAGTAAGGTHAGTTGTAGTNTGAIGGEGGENEGGMPSSAGHSGTGGTNAGTGGTNAGTGGTNAGTGGTNAGTGGTNAGTGGTNAGTGGDPDPGAGSGGQTDPGPTCADGCSQIYFPATAWGDRREWETPLGAKVDLSTSVVSVRFRVLEGSVGGFRLFAKNGGPTWGSKYTWEGLPTPGTWTTVTLDLTTELGNLVATEVETLGVAYETGGEWATTLGDIRIDIDSISVTNASVGPWNFTTSEAPMVLGWTASPQPGTVTWIMPEN